MPVAWTESDHTDWAMSAIPTSLSRIFAEVTALAASSALSTVAAISGAPTASVAISEAATESAARSAAVSVSAATSSVVTEPSTIFDESTVLAAISVAIAEATLVQAVPSER